MKLLFPKNVYSDKPNHRQASDPKLIIREVKGNHAVRQGMDLRTQVVVTNEKGELIVCTIHLTDGIDILARILRNEERKYPQENGYKGYKKALRLLEKAVIENREEVIEEVRLSRRKGSLLEKFKNINKIISEGNGAKNFEI
jgi:hypothetical protein